MKPFTKLLLFLILVALICTYNQWAPAVSRLIPQSYPYTGEIRPCNPCGGKFGL